MSDFDDDCPVFARFWHGTVEDHVQIIGEPVEDIGFQESAAIDVWSPDKGEHRIALAWFTASQDNGFHMIPLTPAAREMLALVTQ